MLGQQVFIWNMRGLNSHAHREVVREFLQQERVSIVCLSETKVDVLHQAMANDIMGSGFDYLCLPADGASCGIIVAWCRHMWVVSSHAYCRYSVSIRLHTTLTEMSPWSLAVVFGPLDQHLKPEFLDELRAISTDSAGPLLVCGDFN